MESWTRLNLMLSLDEDFQKKKKELTKKLIDGCMTSDKEKVVTAIADGAFVNSYDDYQTPLMACAEVGNIDLAKILMKFNANPSIIVGTYDAIWISLLRKRKDFLELFFSKKYKLNTLKENAKTLLIYATEQSYLEAVEIIAYKVNVNQKDSFGNTALAYNLSKPNPTPDDIEITKILLACGADKNSVNLDGVKAKDMAGSMISSSLLEKDDISQAIDENIEIQPENVAEKPRFKL